MHLRFRDTRLRLATLGVIVLASLGSSSMAQTSPADPDARNIVPSVMLLVDTSGSMERVGSCACTTPGCSECLPTCSGSAVGTNERNRWAMVLEALTGDYTSFTCAASPRTVGSPDYGYYLPHYAVTSTVQATNGVLDTYSTRAKFGLMTFDNMATLINDPPLMDSATWATLGARITGADGDYSYGEDKHFRLPLCATDYVMNNGARNESAVGFGRLWSPGSDSITPADRANTVSAELGYVRPYGATPTAGMLEDYRYFLNHHADVKVYNSTDHSGDRYHDCRKRYAILITDGHPNADMMLAPYSCEDTAHSGVCPYETPLAVAADLCQFSGGKCTGELDGLFVVGFNVTGDPTAVATLNDIAAAGGTTAAYFADNASTLRTALGVILDQAAPGTTSRAVPAVSSSASSISSQMQSQFNAGYQVGTNDGPWSGVLERKRTICPTGTTTPTVQPIDSTDRFQDILNATPVATRTIYTVVPTDYHNDRGHLVADGLTTPKMVTDLTATSVNGNQSGVGTGGASGACAATSQVITYAPAQDNLPASMVAFSSANVPREHFGVTTDSERDDIIDWVRGTRPSGVSAFGDIYHSSPVVVGRPLIDIADESYNAFRRSTAVVNRPTMLYVGTNDGILHAFVAEDTRIAGATVVAGTELWGFVPPAVFADLGNARTNHTWTVDGTPYVRDVYFERAPGQSADASIYHTVMIVPLGRGGAGAYFALDITDPTAPKFLWQFGSTELGKTVGSPAMGQVLVTVGSDLKERAVAILPGGSASPITDSLTCAPSSASWTSEVHCAPTGIAGLNGAPLNDPTNVGINRNRCWGTEGRHVFFLDPATGQVVHHLNDAAFNAPMNGGVGLYSGGVGTVATRAFLSDADGVMWRLDLSSKTPADWTTSPFADLFVDMRGGATAPYPTGGQPASFPPVITTNTDGNVVIIQGTGDPDYFDSTAPNRILSLEETLNFDTSGAVTSVGVTTNWTQALPEGEQVTGAIQLFNGVAFFSTFASAAGADACALGTGRVWGLDAFGDSGSVVGKLTDGTAPAVTNQTVGTSLVMGVQITQQLTCLATGGVENDYDPYVGTRPTQPVTGSGGGNFQLLALTSGASTGAAVGEFTRQLQAPAVFSTVSGFAGRAE